MTLATQIRNLSDEELLDQLASACGWEKRIVGANSWYVNRAEEIMSGKVLSLDHTIRNAVNTLDDFQIADYTHLMRSWSMNDFDFLQAPARNRAEALLNVHSKFPD